MNIITFCYQSIKYTPKNVRAEYGGKIVNTNTFGEQQNQLAHARRDDRRKSVPTENTPTEARGKQKFLLSFYQPSKQSVWLRIFTKSTRPLPKAELVGLNRMCAARHSICFSIAFYAFRLHLTLFLLLLFDLRVKSIKFHIWSTCVCGVGASVVYTCSHSLQFDCNRMEEKGDFRCNFKRYHQIRFDVDCLSISISVRERNFNSARPTRPASASFRLPSIFAFPSSKPLLCPKFFLNSRSNVILIASTIVPGQQTPNAPILLP